MHLAGPATPFVEHCTLQDWRTPLAPGEGGAAPVVALGKFDAMHRGHAALAATAALQLGGQPVLLSFSGMARVLGWPPRAPLVARCDRARVLRSWAPACGGRALRQRYIPFDQVRNQSPAEFVALLARELRASGVVAGRNYRFGFRAAGDAAALQELGAAEGLRVAVVDLVTEGPPPRRQGSCQAVSSSRVRELLASGRVRDAAALLQRPYRLVAELQGDAAGGPAARRRPNARRQAGGGAGAASALVAASGFLNLAPCAGRYGCSVQLHPGATREVSLLSLEEAGGAPARVGAAAPPAPGGRDAPGTTPRPAPASVVVEAEIELTPEGAWLPWQLLEGAGMAGAEEGGGGGLVVLDFRQRLDGRPERSSPEGAP